MTPRPELGSLLDCRATVTLMVTSATLSVLRFTGSDFDALIASPENWSSEPWRLISATWLHGGAFHLLFNLYWLAILGERLEKRIGLPTMIGLLLATGLGSSAAEVAFGRGGIGLSGIGYGLFGCLWSASKLQPHRGTWISKDEVVLFVGWFFLCIALTAQDVLPIANYAHGFGAAFGAAVGFLLFGQRRVRSRFARCAPLAGVSLLVLLSLTVGRSVFGHRPTLALEYERAGRASYDANDFEAAAVALSQAVRYQPRSGRLRWNLFLSQWQLESWDAALDSADRARELGFQVDGLEDSFASFLRDRTYALLDQQDLASALQESERALERIPGHPLLISQRGYLFQREQNWPEAIRWYRLAREAGYEADWMLETLKQLESLSGTQTGLLGAPGIPQDEAP